MIQGVSQQDPAQRRDSQCEYQLNCINSPRLGVVARNGAEFFKCYDAESFEGAYCYDIARGNERYLITIATGGGVRIFNILTGIEATVTDLTGDTYFTASGSLAADVGYDAKQVVDYTFVTNRSVAPAMAAGLSTVRPKEAMVFIKAGAYSTKYSVQVRFGGHRYKYTFLVPDNSNAANGIYVATDAIANIMYQMMTNDTSDVDNGYGVGSKFVSTVIYNTVEVDGVRVGTPGGGDLVSHGFHVDINGSLLRIWRDDGVDFTIDSSDGGADAFIAVFKDTVPSYTQLPRGGFLGFLLKVTGASSSRASTNSGNSSFFVEFSGAYSSAGDWRERVGPGVKTSLNAATMPHAIKNVGLNNFELQALTWSGRIAGDGVLTAKDPGFIGKPVNTVLYGEQRLGLLTDSTLTFSKARNSYTLFPDTVQTVLDDAPIDLEIVSTDKSVSTSRASQVDEGLTIWAQQQQFRVAATTQLLFTQASVAAKPSTAYEFADRAGFAIVGKQLYFASEPDDYAVIRAITYADGGRAQGDVDITAHIPNYIPAGVRLMSSTDTGRMIFVRTEGDPNALYCYNYLLQGSDIVQSAWNRWELPEGMVILWHRIFLNVLYIFGDHEGQVLLLKCPLSNALKDSGGAYRTRLDFRATEAECVMVYDAGNAWTTVTLPYKVSVDEAAKMEVVIRTSSAGYVRGSRIISPVRVDANHLRFPACNLTAELFYIGIVPTAIRDESQFFLRSSEGETPTDTLTVNNFEVRLSKTGYTRIEVTQGQGRGAKKAELGYGFNIVADAPPALQSKKLKIACDQDADKLSIRVINDTPYPSQWIRAVYEHQSATRANIPQANRA
jgi:hypothetical protein